MVGSYNEVTPLKLGRAAAERRKVTKRSKKQTNSAVCHIPAPPSDSPPPSHEPDWGSSSTKLNTWNNQISSEHITHSTLDNNQAQSYQIKIKSLPKPTSSGIVFPARVDSSYGFSSQLTNNIKFANLQNKMDGNMALKNFSGQHSDPLFAAPHLNGNQLHKTTNTLKRKKKENMDDDMNHSEEAERKRKRAEKFKIERKRNETSSLDEEENFANLNAISTKSHRFDKNKRIVGRCQTLEKSYLRLTSEPNPDLVRPLGVLKKTYALLMNKHKKNKASYQYLCDQFKSMRQDLRVQMIENQFTIKVYESHARIALENDDIGEFNQCQSRLIVLFELPNVKASFLEEFTSYRILYYMLTENNGSINMLRLNLMKKNQAVFSNQMVRTAFDLAHARLLGDYHNFMKIYASLQTLGKKLVDAFIEKEKLRSLVTICKSYNQINLDFLISELKFENKTAITSWLQKKSLDRFIVTRTSAEKNEFQYFDTKACRSIIVQQYSDSKKIDIKGQQ